MAEVDPYYYPDDCKGKALSTIQAKIDLYDREVAAYQLDLKNYIIVKSNKSELVALQATIDEQETTIRNKQRDIDLIQMQNNPTQPTTRQMELQAQIYTSKDNASACRESLKNKIAQSNDTELQEIQRNIELMKDAAFKLRHDYSKREEDIREAKRFESTHFNHPAAHLNVPDPKNFRGL
jgi:hypothetical protein